MLTERAKVHNILLPAYQRISLIHIKWYREILSAPLIISILTDFGQKDAYVASLKGTILGICPKAIIIDITHHVAQFNIVQAGFYSSSSVDTFSHARARARYTSKGELVLIIGSSNYVEVSINQRNAQKVFNATVNDPIKINAP